MDEGRSRDAREPPKKRRSRRRGKPQNPRGTDWKDDAMRMINDFVAAVFRVSRRGKGIDDARTLASARDHLGRGPPATGQECAHFVLACM